MRTIAQKRKRMALFKAGLTVILVALLFTPKFDNLDLPDIGFPLVTTAIASPLEHF